MTNPAGTASVVTVGQVRGPGICAALLALRGSRHARGERTASGEHSGESAGFRGVDIHSLRAAWWAVSFLHGAPLLLLVGQNRAEARGPDRRWSFTQAAAPLTVLKDAHRRSLQAARASREERSRCDPR